jgi:hypothetical protein
MLVLDALIALCCPPPSLFLFRVQVILDTLALSAAIKKTPVVVGNCTGFAVNRVFFPYNMAAFMLVRCMWASEHSNAPPKMWFLRALVPET